MLKMTVTLAIVIAMICIVVPRVTRVVREIRVGLLLKIPGMTLIHSVPMLDKGFATFIPVIVVGMMRLIVVITVKVVGTRTIVGAGIVGKLRFGIVTIRTRVDVTPIIAFMMLVMIIKGVGVVGCILSRTRVWSVLMLTLIPGIIALLSVIVVGIGWIRSTKICGDRVRTLTLVGLSPRITRSMGLLG